jgi:hypothetical protein
MIVIAVFAFVPYHPGYAFHDKFNNLYTYIGNRQSSEDVNL